MQQIEVEISGPCAGQGCVKHCLCFLFSLGAEGRQFSRQLETVPRIAVHQSCLNSLFGFTGVIGVSRIEICVSPVHEPVHHSLGHIHIDLAVFLRKPHKSEAQLLYIRYFLIHTRFSSLEFYHVTQARIRHPVPHGAVDLREKLLHYGRYDAAVTDHDCNGILASMSVGPLLHSVKVDQLFKTLGNSRRKLIPGLAARKFHIAGLVICPVMKSLISLKLFVSLALIFSELHLIEKGQRFPRPVSVYDLKCLVGPGQS